MKIASFGKGSVYKDSRGYLTASIHMNGRQHLKHVRTVQQAREWLLCMETDSTQAAQLKYAQLNDAASALDILKSHNLTMTLTQLATLWVKDRPTTCNTTCSPVGGPHTRLSGCSRTWNGCRCRILNPSLRLRTHETYAPLAQVYYKDLYTISLYTGKPCETRDRPG